MTVISNATQAAKRNRAPVGILSIKGNNGSGATAPEASLELQYSRFFEKDLSYVLTLVEN